MPTSLTESISLAKWLQQLKNMREGKAKQTASRSSTSTGGRSTAHAQHQQRIANARANRGTRSGSQVARSTASFSGGGRKSNKGFLGSSRMWVSTKGSSRLSPNQKLNVMAKGLQIQVDARKKQMDNDLEGVKRLERFMGSRKSGNAVSGSQGTPATGLSDPNVFNPFSGQNIGDFLSQTERGRPGAAVGSIDSFITKDNDRLFERFSS